MVVRVSASNINNVLDFYCTFPLKPLFIDTGGAKLHVQIDGSLPTATEHFLTLAMWVQVHMTTETGMERGSNRRPFGLLDHGLEGKTAQTFGQD